MSVSYSIIVTALRRTIDDTDTNNILKSLTTLSKQQTVTILSDTNAVNIKEVLFSNEQEDVLGFILLFISNLYKEGITHQDVAGYIKSIYNVFIDSDMLTTEYKKITKLTNKELENIDTIMYYVILLRLNIKKVFNIIEKKVG